MKLPKFPSILRLSAKLALLCLALSVKAAPPVNLYPIESYNQVGCPHAMTGTLIYALSSAVSGTTSGPIDMGAYGCFTFSITATGANLPVRMWQSNNSTTYTAGTTNTAGTQVANCMAGGPNAQAVYTWTKQARYVWFDIPPISPSKSGPNYTTPVAGSYSVFYLTPTAWPN